MARHAPRPAPATMPFVPQLLGAARLFLDRVFLFLAVWLSRALNRLHFASLWFAGVRVQLPRAEAGPPGAPRVRPGGGCVRVPAGHGREPVVRHFGRVGGGQDGDHQVHPAVPLLRHQQRVHLGGAADPRGQYDP